jgi:hypothetical protein
MSKALYDRTFNLLVLVNLILLTVYMCFKIPDVLIHGFEHQNIDALYVTVDKCDLLGVEETNL